MLHKYLHTITKLIEASREYKLPLCLTFIDLKKALDSVETEASGFTTKISPFYNDVVIDVKRARQGDTISPKLFSATLENVMRKLEWEDMVVKVDGRQLQHLRFADDITPNISQAKRMLADFDRVCGNVGLQLNLTKTMFMRNGWVSDAPFSLNGTNISGCSSYVYLGREVNMANDRRGFATLTCFPATPRHHAPFASQVPTHHYEAHRSVARVQAAAVPYVHRPEEGIGLCRD
ncbi:unnamed protein product [Heligmosomoides polygyrus]|uniref:Reverse transcriptase domain-containing protein n=1 Tax=Heligmosomoides polygyrus TaxID=6339 RepID=A0A3P7U9C6_HELPZ|nr:unnamed protein product [Heligmosomoides polygyrus]